MSYIGMRKVTFREAMEAVTEESTNLLRNRSHIQEKAQGLTTRTGTQTDRIEKWRLPREEEFLRDRSEVTLQGCKPPTFFRCSVPLVRSQKNNLGKFFRFPQQELQPPSGLGLKVSSIGKSPSDSHVDRSKSVACISSNLRHRGSMPVVKLKNERRRFKRKRKNQRLATTDVPLRLPRKRPRLIIRIRKEWDPIVEEHVFKVTRMPFFSSEVPPEPNMSPVTEAEKSPEHNSFTI